MVMLEAAIVVGLAGLLVFWVVSYLLRSTGQGPQVTPAGTWRVAHYDAKGETRVVLQKVREGDTRVVDEHVIASVRADDPAPRLGRIDAVADEGAVTVVTAGEVEIAVARVVGAPLGDGPHLSGTVGDSDETTVLAVLRRR